MGKSKKKRNKKYTGADAAIQGNKVTKIKAKTRHPIAEWYVDNKRRVIGWLVIVGTLLILYGVGTWLFGLIF